MKILEAIELAKKITKRTASLKDWQVRSRELQRKREAARELCKGKGYVIDLEYGTVYGIGCGPSYRWGGKKRNGVYIADEITWSGLRYKKYVD